MKGVAPRRRSLKRCHTCACPRLQMGPPLALEKLPGFAFKGAADTSTATLEHSPRKLQCNEPVTVSGYFVKLVNEPPKARAEVLNEEFLKELCNFQLRDSAFAREEVLQEVDKVGRFVVKGAAMSGRKRTYECLNEEDKENFPVKFPCVPPDCWVFQTPPNRKLNFGAFRAQEGIKPAVVETLNDRKVLYEMNNKVQVDLSNFTDKQEVSIDKRFMVETSATEENNKFDFCADLELEQHFLSLTCRPKKAVPSMSRCTTAKRKRDIFEAQPSCSNDNDDVSFLDTFNMNVEESFTFQFSSDSVEGGTTGHLLDNEGNRKNSFNLRF